MRYEGNKDNLITRSIYSPDLEQELFDMIQEQYLLFDIRRQRRKRVSAFFILFIEKPQETAKDTCLWLSILYLYTFICTYILCVYDETTDEVIFCSVAR